MYSELSRGPRHKKKAIILFDKYAVSILAFALAIRIGAKMSRFLRDSEEGKSRLSVV